MNIDDLFPPTPVKEADVLALIRQLPKNSFLYNYICHAGASTDAHVGYHVAAGLALLTQSCPTNLSIPIGTAKYANFFALILGASTTSRKTASIEIACDVLKRAIPGARGSEPGSQEMLRDSMVSQPRKLIVYEEFGAFLAATAQGYMQQLKTAYTALFDCSPVSRETVKSKGQQTLCENPRLSLLCGSTFEFLEEHTEEVDWTGGFLARFFTFYAFRERIFSPEPVVNEAARNMVAGLLQQRAERTSYGICTGLSPEASQAIQAFQERLQQLTMSEDVPKAVAAAVGRSTSMLYRIALMLSWDIGDVHDTEPWAISGLAMRLACMICDFHVRSCRLMGERLTPDRDMRERKRVLDAIGEDPTPLAYILKKAQLLKPRFRIIIETLLAEGTIVTAGTGHGSNENIMFRRATAAESGLYRAAPELKPLDMSDPFADPSADPFADPPMATVIPIGRAQASAQASAQSSSMPDAGGAEMTGSDPDDPFEAASLRASTPASATSSAPAASSASVGFGSASTSALSADKTSESSSGFDIFGSAETL